MTLRLKPLGQQVLVVTGASSGIGLVTARQASQRGACVVLAARNEMDLHHATDDIRRRGGRAAYAVADVSDASQVDAIADTALREFGRIDTWVNNAAFDSQSTSTPANGRDDNLYSAMPYDGGERGRNWDGPTRESSGYTRAALHPRATAAISAGVSLGAGAATAALRARSWRR